CPVRSTIPGWGGSPWDRPHAPRQHCPRRDLEGVPLEARLSQDARTTRYSLLPAGNPGPCGDADPAGDLPVVDVRLRSVGRPGVLAAELPLTARGSERAGRRGCRGV